MFYICSIYCCALLSHDSNFIILWLSIEEYSVVMNVMFMQSGAWECNQESSEHIAETSDNDNTSPEVSSLIK